MGPYTLILLATAAISPLALILAQKQDQKTKSLLKSTFIFLLLSQIIFSLADWKALAIFLAITLIQLVLLFKKPSTAPFVVLLNFINTGLFFLIMINTEKTLGPQPVNLAAIAAVFALLINNVIGLLFINREKHLKTNLPPLSLAWLILAIIALLLWQQRAPAAALAKVSALPEVKAYLQKVPNAHIVIDHEDKAANAFIIHVYEVKDNHTATFNWYEYDKKTGQVTAEF